MVLKSKAASEAPAKIASFGDFQLDFRTNELFKNGQKCDLPEQAARILKLMLQNPGELITRQQICQQIWPDLHIDYDAGLNTAIRSIRRALGDKTGTPGFIETIPRRGYRFLAMVKTADNNPSPTSTATSISKMRPLHIGFAATLLLTAVLGVFLWQGFAKPEPAPKEQKQISYLQSPAYEDFLRAKHALTQSDHALAKLLLEKTIETDPKFAPAFVGIARLTVHGRRQGSDAIERGLALVERALEIDPNLAEAYVLKAGITLYYFRDTDGARALLSRAQELSPGDAQAYVTEAYANAIEGKMPAALTAIAKAHAINPLSASSNADYGWVHYKAHNWSDAERLCRTSVELSSKSAFALECVIHVNHSQHDYAEVAEFGLELMALRGASIQEMHNIRTIEKSKDRALAYWNWALNWAVQNTASISDPLSNKAIILTKLGRADEAIAIFQNAFEQNGEAFLSFLAIDPRVDELRSHPGFAALAAKSRTPIPRQNP